MLRYIFKPREKLVKCKQTVSKKALKPYPSVVFIGFKFDLIVH